MQDPKAHNYANVIHWTSEDLLGCMELSDISIRELFNLGNDTPQQVRHTCGNILRIRYLSDERDIKDDTKIFLHDEDEASPHKRPKNDDDDE
jgi:hypothetical protein